MEGDDKHRVGDYLNFQKDFIRRTQGRKKRKNERGDSKRNPKRIEGTSIEEAAFKRRGNLH